MGRGVSQGVFCWTDHRHRRPHRQGGGDGGAVTPAVPAEVEETVARRDLFRRNAQEALAAGEYPKAAELTWGAVAQEWIRAAFFLKNQVIGHVHAQFRDLGSELATLTGDRYFVDEYNGLGTLHNYFYRPTALAAVEVSVPTLMRRADVMIERCEQLIAAHLSPAEPR